MKNVDERTCWRIIAIITFIVWGFVTLGNLYVHALLPYKFNEKDLIPPAMMLLLYISTLVGCGVLIAFPCQFYIYTFFCCIWGIVHLVEGGNVPGFLMYCLGMIFAIEKGFFATRWKLKLPLSAVVLVAVLLSQIRYGGELLFNTLQDLAVVFLIVGMGVFLLRHRLQNLYKEHGETDEIEVVATPLLQSQKKLMLPCDKFKRQDVSMAQGILAGKKYTAIASEQRMGLSTLKRRTKLLFKYARVANRQIFMAKYEGYTVELEIEDSVSPVVDSASHS